MKSFDQPAGNDADNTRVPAIATEDDYMSMLFGQPGNSCFCFTQSLFLKFLACAITLVKVTSRVQGPHHVFFEQKLYTEGGIFHASRSVQARRQLEANNPTRNLLNRSNLFECPQTDARSFFDQSQTMFGHGPVDSLQRHKVGNRPQGDQVEIIAQIRFSSVSEPAGLAQCFAQGDQQKKSHAHSCQGPKWKIGILPLWVNDC